MAYAILKTGGKQYRVQVGQTLDVDCIDSLAEGEETSFDQVLLIENDGATKVGSPFIVGASVQAKVLSQYLGKKVIAFKFKRRKGFHKKKGFRRSLTKIEITGIKG